MVVLALRQTSLVCVRNGGWLRLISAKMVWVLHLLAALVSRPACGCAAMGVPFVPARVWTAFHGRAVGVVKRQADRAQLCAAVGRSSSGAMMQAIAGHGHTAGVLQGRSDVAALCPGHALMAEGFVEGSNPPPTAEVLRGISAQQCANTYPHAYAFACTPTHPSPEHNRMISRRT